MLSEEQAIENLKDFKSISILYGNTFTIFLEQLKKYQEATDVVLNLITNLQKENEDLQREKEENKLIIAMANNEMLGYNQGYSDGKNQNSNATEIIIKNRQAYMHKEEVEFYKRNIEFLKKENEEKDNKVRKIISRLDNDYKKITETKAEKSKHYLDDYTRCRLKAYRTKTREIKEYIEKQYFETKAKKGE